MIRRFRLAAFCLLTFCLLLWGRPTFAQPADDAEQAARTALEQAQQAKDWQRALHYLDVLLKRRPRDIALLGQKGDALNAAGKPEDAMTLFRQRTELAPKDAGAWNDLCWQLMFARGPSKARPACQRSIALHKRYDNIANLGHTYLLTGDSKTAYRWYRQTLTMLDHDAGLFAPKGPITAFDQFIKNGWLTNESRKARAWMLRHFNESREAEELKQRADALAQQIDRQPAFYPDAAGNRLTQTYLQENAKVIALLEKARTIVAKRRGAHHPQMQDILRALADRHAISGHYQQAEKILQAMLKQSKKQYGPRHSQTADTLTRLTLLHMQARQYHKARPLTKQLIALSEKSHASFLPATLERMEQIAAHYQRAMDAENELVLRRRILTLSEKNGHPSSTNLMRLAELQGQIHKQKQAAASRSQPTNPTASEGTPARSETATRDALRKAWQAQDWAQALQHLDVLIQRYPNNGTLVRWQSHLLAQLGRTEESIAAARRSTILTPDNDDAWNGLCWQLILVQRLPEARAACQRSVAIKKNFANTVNLGHTYLLEGDKHAAYDHYRESVALIRSERELTKGPLNDFDTFIRKGWRQQENQQAREWFVREYAQRQSAAPPGQRPAK